MCGHRSFRPFFGGHSMHKMMCCPPGGMSKKSKIKSLEAMKSHLEDYISEIDEKISELEKGEEVEA